MHPTSRRLWAAVCTLLLLMAAWAVAPAHAQVQYPTITIRFSDLGGIGSDSWPLYRNYVERTGYIIDGYTMVKLSDLVQILGATVTQSGSRYDITRNGQTTHVWLDSTSFATSVTYTVTDRQTNQTKTYSHYWTGTTQKPTQTIGGATYVQLVPIAHSLGVLLIRYNTSASPARVDVFDFRVNGTTPVADPNTYVVGGRWLTGWDQQGSTQIAPHFVLSEYWDGHTNISPTYQKQLKVAVAALQSLENVRYLMGNTPFTPTSAFRSWEGNQAAGSTAGRSWHMRGRAWDAGGQAMYDKVKQDISPVVDADPYDYWRTGNPNSVSRCYEIEKMPMNGIYWLHCQREPGSNTQP